MAPITNQINIRIMRKRILRKISLFMIRLNAHSGSAVEVYDELLCATGEKFNTLCSALKLTPEEEVFLVEQSIYA